MLHGRDEPNGLAAQVTRNAIALDGVDAAVFTHELRLSGRIKSKLTLRIRPSDAATVA